MSKILPLVSIVMPAYNAEKYIQESIESVLNQDYDNWELIIVDDASTDGTRTVIERQLQDERVRFLCNESNKGIAETTNRAIDLAKGDYVALLDDDDISMSHRLKVQVDYLERHPEIDLLGGRTIFINAQGDRIRYGQEPRCNPRYIHAMLLLGSVNFMNSTVMFRKRIWDKNKLKYENDCYGMQDYRFFIEISKIGNISAIDDLIVKHRFHETNTTNICLRNNTQLREQRYKEFQEYSMKLDGFVLTDDEWTLIHELFSEFGQDTISKDRLHRACIIFNKILEQGKNNHLDYINELESFLKNKLLDLFRKLNYSEIEGLLF